MLGEDVTTVVLRCEGAARSLGGRRAIVSCVLLAAQGLCCAAFVRRSERANLI
jgi:hypothetical protein